MEHVRTLQRGDRAPLPVGRLRWCAVAARSLPRRDPYVWLFVVWTVLVNRRDGMSVLPHFAYFDTQGRAHKAFVLP